MQELKVEDLKLDKIEIVKSLSKTRKNKKQPGSKLSQKIDDMINFAEPLMDPRAIYEIFPINSLPRKPYFENALHVGMAICTIGDNLPNRVEDFLTNGQLVNGVILDAIGSVAAEAVADHVDELIKTKSKDMDLVASMRYSPGYCDAPLSDQTIIFDKLGQLQRGKFGVELSPEFLMKPIKSVSFAVNIGLTFINRCRTCTKENCPHRR